MPHTKSRLLGSSYTALFFGMQDRGARLITFCRSYNETPPRLVSEYRPIHPLDYSFPAEIMTAKAMTAGTIEVELIETWSEQAWNRFGQVFPQLGGRARNGGTACDTILDIVRIVDNAQGQIYVVKLIDTPPMSGETTVGHHRRAVIYLGCKIVEVRDGDENVDIETMEQTKRVVFAYTHREYRYDPVGGQGPQNFNPPIPSARRFTPGLPAVHSTI